MKKLVFGSLIAIHSILGFKADGNQFAVQGEYLYFQPLIDHNHYAIIGDAEFVPTGKRSANKLGFHSGYRVEGIYSFCNLLNDLRFRWTYLKSSHTDTVTSDSTDIALGPTEGAPNAGISTLLIGNGESDLRFRYQSADLIFTHLLYDCSPSQFFVQAGVQYADIKIAKQININAPEASPPTSTSLQNKGHFWGFGPELGGDFYYAFPENFGCFCYGNLGLFINTRAALLVGRSNVHWIYGQINDGISVINSDIHDDTITRIVPYWDIKIGLNYEFCASCFNVNLEVGYEILSYVDAVSFLRFDNPTLSRYSNNVYNNVGMHGLFAGIGIGF